MDRRTEDTEGVGSEKIGWGKGHHISPEACRDAVHDTLTNLGIGKCYMVGHSMGGAIAMLYALTYPELLDGLILVARGAKLRVFPEILQGILVDKEGTVRKIAEYAFRRKLRRQS